MESVFFPWQVRDYFQKNHDEKENEQLNLTNIFASTAVKEEFISWAKAYQSIVVYTPRLYRAFNLATDSDGWKGIAKSIYDRYLTWTDDGSASLIDHILIGKRSTVESFPPNYILIALELYESGIVDFSHLVTLLSIKDEEGNCPLYDAYRFEEALPLLGKLDAASIVTLLSLKNQEGNCLLHFSNLFEKAIPLLKKLNAENLVTLLSLTDDRGKSPLHYSSLFEKALPLLERLDAENLVTLLLLTDDQGKSPLHYSSLFEKALPLLERLDAENLVTLLSLKEVFPLFDKLDIQACISPPEETLSLVKILLKLKRFAELNERGNKKIESIKTLGFFTLEKVASPSLQAKKEPIVIEKGKGKVKEFLQVDKKKHLGTGASGEVYELKGNSNLAVKTSKENLSNEYKISYKINHPNFVKSYALYLKKYSDGYKSLLVMDKVKGRTILNHFCDFNKFPDEDVKNFIQQARNCCLYLFDNKIVWSDVKGSNAFIDSSGLKLIDYGLWCKEKNIEKRAIGLLAGSQELVKIILEISLCNKSVREEISFPRDFNLVVMENKIKNKDIKAIREDISSYFDVVIKQFNNERRLSLIIDENSKRTSSL